MMMPVRLLKRKTAGLAGKRMFSSKHKGVMVAATRQHVGKTTSCLALVSKLLENYENVGFIKPVGQRSILVEDGLRVDKDVQLFKEYFNLTNCDYSDMSPVVIPPGYTRSYLDGDIKEADQIRRIEESFERIASKNSFTISEGTGHCGVGSIVHLDNARVASLLGLDMVLVVNGGLGSAFDELALNRLMCLEHNVKIRGVLVNKAQPDKVDMLKDYFSRALSRWGVPLLGVVPDGPFLSNPTMRDFKELFKGEVLCGHDQVLGRHFDNITLVAMDLHGFLNRLDREKHSKTLFVTHATRLDLILGFVSHAATHQERWGEPWRAGLVIAHEDPTFKLAPHITQLLNDQSHPTLLVAKSTYEVMVQIHNYTAKLTSADPKRTKAAIKQYTPHIDLGILLGEM